MAKKLIRMEDKKMIGGVCAGFADYLDIDISLIRLLFVILHSPIERILNYLSPIKRAEKYR